MTTFTWELHSPSNIRARARRWQEPASHSTAPCSSGCVLAMPRVWRSRRCAGAVLVLVTLCTFARVNAFTPFAVTYRSAPALRQLQDRGLAGLRTKTLGGGTGRFAKHGGWWERHTPPDISLRRRVAAWLSRGEGESVSKWQGDASRDGGVGAGSVQPSLPGGGRILSISRNESATNARSVLLANRSGVLQTRQERPESGATRTTQLDKARKRNGLITMVVYLTWQKMREEHSLLDSDVLQARPRAPEMQCTPGACSLGISPPLAPRLCYRTRHACVFSPRSSRGASGRLRRRSPGQVRPDPPPPPPPPPPSY